MNVTSYERVRYFVLYKVRLSRLTTYDRLRFFDLSYFTHGNATTFTEDEKTLAIFQTNAIKAGANDVGLFPLIARLNHGCSSAFNSVYTWRDEEGVLVVHTLRPVKRWEVRLET